MAEVRAWFGAVEIFFLSVRSPKKPSMGSHCSETITTLSTRTASLRKVLRDSFRCRPRQRMFLPNFLFGRLNFTV